MLIDSHLLQTKINPYLFKKIKLRLKFHLKRCEVLLKQRKIILKKNKFWKCKTFNNNLMKEFKISHHPSEKQIKM